MRKKSYSELLARSRDKHAYLEDNFYIIQKERQTNVDLVSTNNGESIDVAHHLVGHEAKDAHLCGTAIVQLNAALLLLGSLIQLVPAKVVVDQ